MNIVHIGKGTGHEEILHIAGLRADGHDVYVPGERTGEQLVRRIIDADQIHIWDATMVFELGMVYFYSVYALHHKLGWSIKVFCDPNPALPVFAQFESRPWPCETGTGACDVDVCMARGGCPPHDSC